MKTDVELEGVGVLLMIQGEDDMVLLVGVAPGDELGRGNAAAAFLVIWVKVALVVMGEVQVSIFLAALAPDSGACFWGDGRLVGREPFACGRGRMSLEVLFLWNGSSDGRSGTEDGAVLEESLLFFLAESFKGSDGGLVG